MRRLAWGVLCLMLPSACSPFGASDPQPITDSGTPSTSPDAATASNGGDAGTSFCADHGGSEVVFCDDFERTDPITSETRWTDGYPTNGAPSIVGPDETTRSQALRARVVFPVGERSAWLRKELTPSAKLPRERSRYRVSFSFAVLKSTITYAAVGALWFTVDGVPAPLLHGVAAVSSGSEVRPTDPSSTTPVLLPQGWHAAVVTLASGAAGWTRQVTIDGQQFSAEPAAGVEASYQLDLRLGVYYAHGVDGEVDVLFDDVLVEAF